MKVELFGESDEEAIKLPPYLMDAYHKAEEFCEMLSHRMQASGFLKTLLLRRIGSSIEAGMNTAQKLLGEWQDIDEEDERRRWRRRPDCGDGSIAHLGRASKAQGAAGLPGGEPGTRSEVRGRERCSPESRLAELGLHHLLAVLRFRLVACQPPFGGTAR